MLVAPMVHGCQKSKLAPRQESGLQGNISSTPLATYEFSRLRFGGYICKDVNFGDLMMIGQLDGTYNFYFGTFLDNSYLQHGRKVEVLTGLTSLLTSQKVFTSEYTWSINSKKLWKESRIETSSGNIIIHPWISSLENAMTYGCHQSIDYAKSPPNIDDTLKILSHKNNELAVIDVKVDALVNDQGKHLILSLTNLKKDRSPLKKADITINSPVINANNEIVGYVKSHKVRGVLGVSILSIHDPAFAQHLVTSGYGKIDFKQKNAKIPSVSSRFISDFCARIKQ